MNIVIIKYNAGNIRSVKMALQRLGFQSTVSDDPQIIRSADKVIFPGVGEASSAMAYLKEKGLAELIPQLTQPLLGICLGLQLMARRSAENDTKCLDIIPEDIRKFPAEGKVPHIGWNTIYNLRGPLFEDVPENSYVYFVHSYYLPLNKQGCAQTDYLAPFQSAVQKDNFFAVQFHPEKSGAAGEKILDNFLRL
ncbi:MAG TPA: imidazole glycerol phosphate synthase subunit HisH [Caldithrix abyssi]|uniref:Imidazole glycerol phosphate synthase subunit HisH n=1 Tax=Caldithrix abyssi TaxID=187145 RepID=A0A7V4WW36_CALAY|nr:imidazole glycerol phosphate synthase subunit HisH [Caldithrix abyssi]